MVIRASDGYVPPTDGEIIRRFLRRARLSPRVAAAKLGIDESRLRDWCNRLHAPRYVLLAVESLACEEFEDRFLDGIYSTVFLTRSGARPKPSTTRRPRVTKKRHKLQSRNTHRAGARDTHSRSQAAEK